MSRSLLTGSLSLALFLAAGPARAAPASEDALGQPATLIVALGVAALLPFAFMTVTAFVKISTVLQIVRSAIGAQNVPSNVVMLALAAALTLLAMAPVGSRIASRAGPLLSPEGDRTTSAWVAGLFDAAREPIRGFLDANTSRREKDRFYEIARAARSPEERAQVGRRDLIVLIPAFVISELLEAFALGFAIYLPFLVIDLVVGNVLLSLGMQMMNPTQVSLPFKLLLFVAVDGWGLLAQALVVGYRSG